MRIAFSADNANGLDSIVAPHFGRCANFVLVDLDNRQVTAVGAVANPFYGQHSPGQVPTFIHQQGANVMITGGMGARAMQFFAQYGITPVTGASGTVQRALDQFLAGELYGAEACLHGEQPEAPPEGEYESDEVGRLREEADALRKQMEEIEKRLKGLN